MATESMDKLVALCKRRGFIFQTNEIYGGLQGVYDYGPLGVELKNNLKRAWWNAMVYERDDIEGIDSSILTNPLVLKQSGHEETFSDPLVDCKNCKARIRADHLKDGKCPECGSDDLTEPRPFNLMFKTNVGPIEDGSSFAYLRPETAQQIFTNFKNVLDSTPHHLPFGIAQIGKAFRNEISPRQFLFRTREFEQADTQLFIKPGTNAEHFEQTKIARMQWYTELGIDPQHLRFSDHDNLVFYAAAATDIEYDFPDYGFDEVEGVHDRTDYDLTQHSKHSGVDLSYNDNGEKFIPYIIETSMGLARVFLALISEAYDEEQLEDGDSRIVLRLQPALAPVRVAVMPLMKKDGLLEKSEQVYADLAKHFSVRLEESGSVGKRYRRQDEIGTPFCVTVDYDTLEDETVTIRFRDSMEQQRVAINELAEFIRKRS